MGVSLWGGEIPGDSSDNYHGQLQAKRKVSMLKEERGQRSFNNSDMTWGSPISSVAVNMVIV